MAAALEYVILGPASGEEGTKARKLRMFSGGLPSFDPKFFVQLVDLPPMPDAAGLDRSAIALVHYDDARMLLTATQPAADRAEGFNEHYVFIPAAFVAESALQLERWLACLPDVSQDLNQTLPLLPAPDFDPTDSETRGVNLRWLLDDSRADPLDRALFLLGALIDGRRLVVKRFPPDLALRLKLIAGLQALLPGRLAAALTYASHAPAQCQQMPQLLFDEAHADECAWLYDYANPAVIDAALDHPYIELLRALWDGDAASLAAEIQRFAPLAPSQTGAGGLAQSLREIAERHRLDRHARAPDDDLSTEAILRVLDSATPPRQTLRFQYIRKLLRNALNERDAAAGQRAAEEMAKDAALEGALADVFDEMLEDQPDAVYVFFRNRITRMGFDDKWLPRLETAARNSLEVAIEEGDVGTLAGWLELIAHEPQSYRLHDVLRDGILLAKERAYNDGELGIHLILIAARRVPEIVDELYADERLINALEAKVRLALQRPTAEALARLIDEKAEYFLLALYHGVQVSDEVLVTLASARRLWTLYANEARVSLPAVYRPPAITRLLATAGSAQLTDEALDFLFDSVIKGDDRKLIAEMVGHFAEADRLFPRLGAALESDELSLDKVLSIMNMVSGLKSAPPQELIDSYFALLDYYQWEPETRRLVEALARLLAKHQEAQASYRHLWKLFDSCQALEIDGATRVSMARLLRRYGAEDDLTFVLEGVARISRQIHLAKALRAALNDWWRRYTHSLSLSQLQRLERELEPQRQLEAQKHILYSVVAMRRWLQSQDPVEFAESINTTFSILEHITDAFDAAHIHEIDSYTIRREVDEVSRGLSSEQRHILATNLRNLAHRITQMAEKRSKPSLIRSDDAIERQLQHGEANPQGSIDMMKWIAGYLDGAHPPGDD